MALLVSEVLFDHSLPAAAAVRDKIQEQTGLNVDYTASPRDFTFCFHIPTRRHRAIHVKCRLGSSTISVRSPADQLNRCPNYYYATVVWSLIAMGGRLSDDELPDHGRLKWTEWKELNGGPYPPLWKEVGFLTIHLISAIIYVMRYIILAAIVILIVLKLLTHLGLR